MKGNQPTLLQNIIATSTQTGSTAHFAVEAHDRGRTKQWELAMFQATDEPLKTAWPGLQNYVVVTKTETKKEIQTITHRYFITDLTTVGAKELAEGIRKHGHIENKVHSIRAVLVNQDKNKIKDTARAVNMATVNTLAINTLLQMDKSIDFAIIRRRAEFQEIVKKMRT